MNIYKDFISKKDSDKIYNTLLSNNFPWYYYPFQVGQNKKDTSFMGHIFLKDGQKNSEAMDLINPIVDKLKPKKIFNIRANLCLRRPSQCSWHVDDFTDDVSHTTAIYYVNTNNGYTEFKNKKVKCMQNKIVIFDAKLKHRAKGQTDKDTRIVINFNYELN
jgi:hypothetical protein|tara:strand:+ start:36 stop:518 length:483 start_codon:yes stop_codon:yes gene_type:complete